MVRLTYGYILSSTAVIGAYAIVLSLLNLTALASVSETLLFRIGFLLAVAFTFEPLHRRSQAIVDRVFYRSSYDYRKTIGRIAEAMTTILDPALVQATFVGTSSMRCTRKSSPAPAGRRRGWSIGPQSRLAGGGRAAPQGA